MHGFTTAWNTHAVERVASYYAENSEILAPPNPEPYRGRSGARKNIQEAFTGIPDMNADVEWAIQQGNKVSALIHMTGTHTGPLVLSPEQTVEATGNKIDIKMGVFIELDDDGKILRETDLADAASLLMQVGAIGAEGAKSESPRRQAAR